MKIKDRIVHAWNAFNGTPTLGFPNLDLGAGRTNPAHKQHHKYRSSTFASAVFNRIAIDVSSVSIEHIKMDTNKYDRKKIDSGLNKCLTSEANIDQTHRQFLQDVVYSMFDEGVVAVVPVDTSISPDKSQGYDIETMRAGRITNWHPQHIKVKLYNEKIGDFQEIVVPKKNAAIIENPLYAVTNGPNVTLSRLVSKMAQLDNLDEVISAGKLDLIIQLPYAVKTELQQKAAKNRVQMLEQQLENNKHGIAYMDQTEKITQLARPVETTLLEDIQYLTNQFYNQLGLTENVFNGTASEAEMRGYYNRTIDPIVDSILAEMNRKFITKTARTQGHTLRAYRDPFTLASIQAIAEVADTFRRNSILTTNEIRAVMGYRPSDDPKANQLYNPNIAEDERRKGTNVDYDELEKPPVKAEPEPETPKGGVVENE